ncbi:tumor necrosis factor receptor superfamily member 11A [Denticeps clupeoides]|nr:tumor necrosis factor receptor superfamily member 11A [Denticeps clupeoides]
MGGASPLPLPLLSPSSPPRLIRERAAQRRAARQCDTAPVPRRPACPADPLYLQPLVHRSQTMRLNFSTSWIFQGWIVCVLAGPCVMCISSCGSNEYSKDKLCCDKCPPGQYVFADCTNASKTKCKRCGTNEYQPDYTHEKNCLIQKFCDTGRGFTHNRPQNYTAPVPCQCVKGFQCESSNCEYCVRIPECPPGEGITAGESDRKLCKACPYGSFSDSHSAEACKAWTNCHTFGKSEVQPGSPKSNAVCGPHPTGPHTSTVMVAILSVIIVMSLVMLSMFFYKEKIKLFSVNVRTCVQNLKRTRIQQETPSPNRAAPHSTFEITCLIPPDGSLNLCPSTPLVTGEEEKAVGPSESSEKEKPASESSCSCVVSMKEPVEVGENEDCSQLVASGTVVACSCGNVDRERDGLGVAGGEGPMLESPLCKNCCPKTLRGCSDCTELQASQDLCLDYSSPAGKEVLPKVRVDLSSRPQANVGLYRQNEPCCCSIDSTTVPVLSSDSSNNQGLSLQDSEDLKLCDAELQSHCSEAALTSGQVTGNNNTTFISSGQVMNFSSDVIVVYVSQVSQGNEMEPDEPFSCPVQEESNEDIFRSIPKPMTDSTPPTSLLSVQGDSNLPVQEVTSEWPEVK